ncbi:MAG: sigma-70 family RNA polymerase sigma factor [Polyangiaceae bacterium]
MVASARAILGPGGESPTAERPATAADRKRALVTEHFAFVWRSLVRLGLSHADAEDAMQQVFLVASRRIEDIDAGAERSFLFGTALRIASRARRAQARRREDLGEVGEPVDHAPGPEELLDRARARALLDEVLDDMAIEVRAVFVLHELEQLTLPEIAELARIPLGTATSRLRRARIQFHAHIKRIEEARKFDERRPSARSKP